MKPQELSADGHLEANVDEFPRDDGTAWACVTFPFGHDDTVLGPAEGVLRVILDLLSWRRHDAGILLLVPRVTKSIRALARSLRGRFPSGRVQVIEIRPGGRSFERFSRFMRREGISWPVPTLNPALRRLKLKWS